jgi:hypothetical protein
MHFPLLIHQLHDYKIFTVSCSLHADRSNHIGNPVAPQRDERANGKNGKFEEEFPAAPNHQKLSNIGIKTERCKRRPAVIPVTDYQCQEKKDLDVVKKVTRTAGNRAEKNPFSQIETNDQHSVRRTIRHEQNKKSEIRHKISTLDIRRQLT